MTKGDNKMKKLILTISILFIAFFTLFAQLEEANETSMNPVQYRVAEWLSSDKLILDQWMESLVARTKTNAHTLSPVVEEFKELIERDPEIYMLFHQMFEQVPNKPPYNVDTAGEHQVRDYHHLLQLINQLITEAPEFNKTGLVGFPINTILNWLMGTEAGASAFLNPKVNSQLKKILNEWAIFLDSPDSRYVLVDDPR